MLKALHSCCDLRGERTHFSHSIMFFTVFLEYLCLLLPFLCSTRTTALLPTTVYRNCGPETRPDSIKNFTITPCPQEPCTFKRGINVTVSIEFTAVADASKLPVDVYGIVGSIPVPYPLPNPYGCKDSNITCPIKNGETYKYVGVFVVLESYPTIELPVKWEMKNQDKTVMLCAVFPMEIVK